MTAQSLLDRLVLRSILKGNGPTIAEIDCDLYGATPRQVPFDSPIWASLRRLAALGAIEERGADPHTTYEVTPAVDEAWEIHKDEMRASEPPPSWFSPEGG